MVSFESLSHISPMASSQPPSVYQPSIYSAYSYPYPTYHSRNGSRERLLPVNKPVLSQSNLRYSGPRTATRQLAGPGARERMASNGIPILHEQKKSYGIGGAGNIMSAIGRPSDVIYPPRTNTDGTPRRSSVWSHITTTSPSTSPEGKRMSLLNLFGKKGSTGVADMEGDGYKEPEYEQGRKD
ncbi:hypothetical protein D0Z07_9378 [Hyphodiscus hymeniophilus]|uniref:Uncharacterized protein n=1 Tax=Hyphodiscus hymeniophilus TaxID=353542 RepID=A0A9P6SKX4_9HELO|nr:hypothetical protein D0Z07_9378 [Hyphodiscus hymeniophilus]